MAYRHDNFALGPFVEGSWYAHPGSSFYDQWNVDLGASAQYKVPVAGHDLTFYGGSFLYWHEAKLDSLSNSGMTGGIPVCGQIKQQQWSNFGGFVGLEFPIVKEKLSFMTEGQLTSKMSLGASLSYLF